MLYVHYRKSILDAFFDALRQVDRNLMYRAVVDIMDIYLLCSLIFCTCTKHKMCVEYIFGAKIQIFEKLAIQSQSVPFFFKV